MIFTEHESTALTALAIATASIGTATGKVCDEQVRITSTLPAPIGYPYCIETSSGALHSGRVDLHGLLPRVFTDNAETYTVHWGEEALDHEGWK
ncbi:hypothetical protein [Paraburkholderia sp. Ac-20340]|uniref:hypothetical protein n=1 Tax=Paraburkholderia sp. Ac-20340 TaxID=2703888 RepID=UPI00197CBFF3|nr:hypothetical protein [Paraburkholderia sp. Ac-20340]